MMLGYLTILVVFFTSCTSQLHLGYYARPRIYQFKPRIDSDNCVCFSNVGHTMADVMQADLQRLVVYLYKDQAGNLKVFTPSKENQRLLPDLKVGQKDLITDVDAATTHMHIQDLFNYDLAVDLKVSKITTGGSNEVNSFVSAREQNSKDDSPLLDEVVSNSQDTDGISNTNRENSPPAADTLATHSTEGKNSPNIGDNVGMNYQTVITNLAFSDEGSSFFDDYAQDSPSSTTLPVIDVSGNNEDLDSTDTDLLEQKASYAPADQSPPVSLRLPAGGQQNFDSFGIQSSESGSQSLKPTVTSVSPVSSWLHAGGQQNLNSFGIQSSETGSQSLKPTVTSVSSVSSWLQAGGQQNLNSFGIQSSESGSQSLKPTVTSVSPDGKSWPNMVQQLEAHTDHAYVTFDAWFDQQMQRIQITGQAPNSNYDISSVKQLLEKTLYENAMYVTKDGVLINSKGDALNVSNLKLRPILIGDSVAYDSVFSVNEYALPTNLPYLEAILVTSVNPPKILGVIPLGKTYIPRISYRKKFDYWDWKSIDPGTNRAGKPNLLQPRVPVVLPSSRLVLKTSGASKKSKSPVAVDFVSPKHSKQFPLRNDYKYGRKALTKPIIDKSKISEFDLKDALRALLTDKLQGKLQGKKAGHLWHQDSDAEDEYDKKPAEEYDEEEEPWFRIIGGNAATSSGTPVSSRGRSGYPYKYW